QTVSEVTGSIGGGDNEHGEYRASATVADSFFDERLKVYANIGFVTQKGPVLDPPYDLQIGPFLAPDNDASFTLGPSTGKSQPRRDIWVPIPLAVDVGHFKVDVIYPIYEHDYREFNDFGGRTDHLLVGDNMIEGVSSERAEYFTLGSLRYERR